MRHLFQGLRKEVTFGLQLKKTLQDLVCPGAHKKYEKYRSEKKLKNNNNKIYNK
jgi:hypothetical protein